MLCLSWRTLCSLLSQAILTYFAVCRFRRGDRGTTIPTYTEPPPDLHTPYPPTYAPTTYTPTVYAAYPGSVSDTHQQPPFTPVPQPQLDSSYQPPGYWVPLTRLLSPTSLAMMRFDLHCAEPSTISSCAFTLDLPLLRVFANSALAAARALQFTRRDVRPVVQTSTSDGVICDFYLILKASACVSEPGGLKVTNRDSFS